MNDSNPVRKWLRRHLPVDQVTALDEYAGLILEGNIRAGLTSLRDRESIERRHIVESLVLLLTLEDHELIASPMIDIGSGAGIPGIVFKIARPELDVTLLEPTGKKALFLRTAVDALRLSGVRVTQATAEEAGRDAGHRQTYRLAVARAVAPLRVLLELALPLLVVGGALAAPKGSAATREIREAGHALREMRGEVERAEPLELPYPGPAPTLIVVRKTAETPDRYPRRAGIPRKRPLQV